MMYPCVSSPLRSHYKKNFRGGTCGKERKLYDEVQEGHGQTREQDGQHVHVPDRPAEKRTNIATFFSKLLHFYVTISIMFCVCQTYLFISADRLQDSLLTANTFSMFQKINL
jgi:hypothetical protein